MALDSPKSMASMPRKAELLGTVGIPGDGRCLFRSVVHGAWLRAGKPSPSESLEKELADDLRDKCLALLLKRLGSFQQVADEFIKRRRDTEWFLEDDFDTYVDQMRQPHVWGGEPELLMSSHVLTMPITVYMREKGSGSLKIIAEYGHEYGNENPVRVLYHGYGHYDALRNLIGGAQTKKAVEKTVRCESDKYYALLIFVQEKMKKKRFACHFTIWDVLLSGLKISSYLKLSYSLKDLKRFNMNITQKFDGFARCNCA
ncbi:unnamed protein product [Dovyalis caffra]|uniref:Ubiquitin thioesterase OTU n=1 Tax=Dovyalis caffra TaxID=77055 RepID=A0AAV1R3J9_9ROSI|nr:unnamed protein product [Dovyalis caffra]